jgi:hypothetical protein
MRSEAVTDLADRLAAHGVRALELELAHFAAFARRRGASPLLVSILSDPTQPDVARERAFGLITVELGNAERTRLPDSGPSAA